MQNAILHARAAVEADSGESRHWHLLGLLLTATGDWRAAKEVLDMGVSVSEAELSDEDPEQIDGLPSSESALDVVSTSSPVELASPPKTNGLPLNGDAHVNGYTSMFLDATSTELPPSESLLQPLGDRPHPAKGGSQRGPRDERLVPGLFL